jgi:hypothetical protein
MVCEINQSMGNSNYWPYYISFHPVLPLDRAARFPGENQSKSEHLPLLPEQNEGMRAFKAWCLL